VQKYKHSAYQKKNKIIFIKTSEISDSRCYSYFITFRGSIAMITESLGLNALVLLFGLFLLGLWMEARRTLNALPDEVPGWNEGAASTWEADYNTLMARRDARTRLAQMRARTEQEAALAAQAQDEFDFDFDDEVSPSNARYDLHVPEFRLIEGGSSSNAGARTPQTREGRKIA